MMQKRLTNRLRIWTSETRGEPQWRQGALGTDECVTFSRSLLAAFGGSLLTFGGSTGVGGGSGAGSGDGTFGGCLAGGVAAAVSTPSLRSRANVAWREIPRCRETAPTERNSS